MILNITLSELGPSDMVLDEKKYKGFLELVFKFAKPTKKGPSEEGPDVGFALAGASTVAPS